MKTVPDDGAVFLHCIPCGLIPLRLDNVILDKRDRFIKKMFKNKIFLLKNELYLEILDILK